MWLKSRVKEIFMHGSVRGSRRNNFKMDRRGATHMMNCVASSGSLLDKLDRRRATDPTSYAALILETRFSFMTS